MGQFALDLAAFAKKAGDNANQVVRTVVTNVHSKIVLRSPVDKGRFIANWFISTGSLSTQTTEQTDTSGQVSLDRAHELMLSYEVGPSVFIVNNLPYGPRLEYGYSQKQPMGMVRVTIAEFEPIVSQAVAAVK